MQSQQTKQKCSRESERTKKKYPGHVFSAGSVKLEIYSTKWFTHDPTCSPYIPGVSRQTTKPRAKDKMHNEEKKVSKKHECVRNL